MITRTPYTEKYKDIHRDWCIDKRKVNKVLKNAMEQLVEELLDNTPWEINTLFRDNRDPSAYMYDLVDGRIFEDLLVLWFESRGAKAERVGTDKDNKIVRKISGRITTGADLMVDGKKLEVQVSRTGKRKVYHVKQGKGNRILRGENDLMFVVGNEFFIVDAEVLAGCEVKPNGAWGGKEAYFVYEKNIDYKPMGEETIDN